MLVAWHAPGRQRSFYRIQGFGLIEVIVVMIMLVILTVTALPSFLNLYQRYHLSSTAQQLVYTLQYAKSAAIKNNQTIYVVFRNSDDWCYGVNVNSTCDCRDTSCTLGNTVAPKLKDMTLSLVGISGGSIQFDGVNGLTLTNAIIYFTAYGQTNSIGVKINALGNAKLCSASMSGYPLCA